MLKKEFLARIDVLLLILCGVLVFSPLSSVITLQILRLPLALPELLFIPFFIFFRNRLDLKIKFKSLDVLLLYFLVLMLAISFIIGNFKIGSILSTSRGYLYMLLSFSIFRGENNISSNDILLICLGSVIGWCFLSLSQFFKILNGNNIEGSFAVYGNLVSLALLIIISMIYNKKSFIVLSFFLGIFISVTSGVRRAMLIVILSFLLPAMMIVFKNIKKPIRFLFVLIISACSLIAFYPVISTYVKDTSPMLYLRIFEKTEQLINGDFSSSDQIRTDQINSFFDEIDTYLYPRGFVSKRTMADKGTGIYMDLPIVELSYMLGIVILSCFLIYYNWCMFYHLKRFYKHSDKESAIWAVSGVIILLLLFLDGTNLNFSYITPFTGLVLGKIFSRN